MCECGGRLSANQGQLFPSLGHSHGLFVHFLWPGYLFKIEQRHRKLSEPVNSGKNRSDKGTVSVLSEEHHRQ